MTREEWQTLAGAALLALACFGLCWLLGLGCASVDPHDPCTRPHASQDRPAVCIHVMPP